MPWGTDIMMLGRLRGKRGIRGLGALNAVDAPSEVLSHPGPAIPGLSGLGTLGGIDFATVAGGYLGALVAGGAIGYIVSPKWDGIMRGGLAAGGIRHLGYVATDYKSNPAWLTAYYGMSGLLSLWWSWSKRKG
jgi:hypothetical protein